MRLSKKQYQLVKRIREQNLPKISVLGSVQSGKTYSICLAVLLYAQDLYQYDPNNKYYGAIIGWDLETIKGNIIEPFKQICEEIGFNNYELKYGNNEKYLKVYNMTFYFFGFNTKLSFNKILGRPLIFVWIDESARIYSQRQFT